MGMGRMMHLVDMTPEEATMRRDYLIHRSHLIKTPAHRAYETIANLAWEYAVQYQDINGEWDYTESSPWKPTAEEAREEERTLQLTGFTTRIVRRLVSEPEEVQP